MVIQSKLEGDVDTYRPHRQRCERTHHPPVEHAGARVVGDRLTKARK